MDLAGCARGTQYLVCCQSTQHTGYGVSQKGISASLLPADSWGPPDDPYVNGPLYGSVPRARGEPVYQFALIGDDHLSPARIGTVLVRNLYIGR